MTILIIGVTLGPLGPLAKQLLGALGAPYKVRG